ncbi:MAG TPA: FKBP-type peptidyl-prolyl cis-trans isomerase [Bacteroidales bacterium]|jgi:FKBP-type peptidyl-prolyl cis-trans isomerase SlyD|nr:peptidylprolyl isomerase [Bacteroidota bacterium]HJN06673.1 FKBP-type peptidyl-prolyl cis-trans isomerase [Bacteroidales bacterium]
MNISPNSIAALSYTLTNNTTDEELEKTPEDKMMKFKFGIGELLPGFEKNLMGLKKGNKFDFIIVSNDAYGPVDPYAVFDIPMDTFEVDGKINEQMLTIGNKIPMTDNDGNKHVGLITLVMESAVTMDFNHPLAGVDLRFVGEVLEVLE